MRVTQSCGKVSGVYMRVCEERYFRTFDSLGDGHVFIIVFKAHNPIINSRENSHRESIEKTDFCDINPFCRAVIH